MANKIILPNSVWFKSVLLSWDLNWLWLSFFPLLLFTFIFQEHGSVHSKVSKNFWVKIQHVQILGSLQLFLCCELLNCFEQKGTLFCWKRLTNAIATRFYKFSSEAHKSYSYVLEHFVTGTQLPFGTDFRVRKMNKQYRNNEKKISVLEKISS